MQMADPLLRSPGVSRRRRAQLGTELGKGKERAEETGTGSQIVEGKDMIAGLERAKGSTIGAQSKEKDDTKDKAWRDTRRLGKERGRDS